MAVNEGASIADALGLAPKQPPEPEPVASAESTADELQPIEQATPDLSERERVAKLLLEDPKLARWVEGDTVDEMVASANSFKATIDTIKAKAEPKPDFGGGVREPVPITGDAAREHGDLLLAMLARASGF
jgi:hypothetical protein